MKMAERLKLGKLDTQLFGWPAAWEVHRLPDVCDDARGCELLRAVAIRDDYIGDVPTCLRTRDLRHPAMQTLELDKWPEDRWPSTKELGITSRFDSIVQEVTQRIYDIEADDRLAGCILTDSGTIVMWVDSRFHLGLPIDEWVIIYQRLSGKVKRSRKYFDLEIYPMSTTVARVYNLYLHRNMMPSHRHTPELRHVCKWRPQTLQERIGRHVYFIDQQYMREWLGSIVAEID